MDSGTQEFSIAAICLEAINISFSQTARAQEIVEEVLRDATERNDERAIGWGLCAQGKVHYAQGKVDRATEDLKVALQKAQSVGDAALEGYCCHFLGACYYQCREFAQAIHFSYQAVLVRRTLADDLDLAYSLGGLGAIQSKLGNWRESADSLGEALEIARRHNNDVVQATMLSNMGELFSDLGEENIQRAVECFAEGAKFAKNLNNNELLINCLTSWARLLIRERQWKEAEALAQEASELARRCAFVQPQINAHVALATVLMEQKRFTEAEQSLRAAKELADQQSSEERYPTIAQTWGQLYKKQGERERAYACLEKARQDAEKTSQRELAIQIEQELSRLSEEMGDYRGALHHFQTFFEKHCAQERQSAQNLLISQKAKHDVERARQEAELERVRNIELAEANRQKDILLAKLRQQADRLARQAIEDPLTGLYNRRYLMEQLESGLDIAQKQGSPLTVMIADLDNFKKINDTFSHAVGDEVLKSTAKLLLSNTRSDDVVARYGGEEFVIVFPNTSAPCAVTICERIRQAVEQFPWAQFHPDLKVSLSIGVADEAEARFEKLLAIADRRLYRAKHNGKNRVVDRRTEIAEQPTRPAMTTLPV